MSNLLKYCFIITLLIEKEKQELIKEVLTIDRPKFETEEEIFWEKRGKRDGKTTYVMREKYHDTTRFNHVSADILRKLAIKNKIWIG